MSSFGSQSAVYVSPAVGTVFVGEDEDAQSDCDATSGLGMVGRP